MGYVCVWVYGLGEFVLFEEKFKESSGIYRKFGVVR